MDDIDTIDEIVEMNKADAIAAVVSQVRHGRPSTGVCRACCEVIDPERIKAQPFAAHCAECAQEIEEEEKKRRR